MRKKIDIDEKAIIASFISDNDVKVPTEMSKYMEPNDFAELGEQTLISDTSVPDISGKPEIQAEHSGFTDDIDNTKDGSETDSTKRTIKQRKTALDEYRRLFMQAPKIDDRKPVFVSRDTRDRLDRIMRLFGDRKMSVSGLIENLALYHLKVYENDIDFWRKL